MLLVLGVLTAAVLHRGDSGGQANTTPGVTVNVSPTTNVSETTIKQPAPAPTVTVARTVTAPSATRTTAPPATVPGTATVLTSP